VEDRELLITIAMFGSGRKVAVVAKRVTELLASEPKEFFANAAALKADLWPYRRKALATLYRFPGKDPLFVVQGEDRVTYKMLVDNKR